MEDFLKQTWMGNTTQDYLWVIGILVVGALFIMVVHHFLLKRLQKWAQVTQTTLDDFGIALLEKIGRPLSYWGIFYVAVNWLTLNEEIQKGVNIAGAALLTVYITRLAIMILHYGVGTYTQSFDKSAGTRHSMSAVLRFGQWILWGIAIVFFLENLGINVSTVVAGLGISGIAMALAAQTILKDLLCYFAIILDRPFIIGDFIIVGDMMGVVENIGILTTRVTSLSGEQLVFSNADLIGSRVRNYKKMRRRRVLFNFGVTYQTSAKQLKTIPGLVKGIIESNEDTIFDRAHFAKYGASSLDFEVVYYVDGSDYNKYMDIQQAINLAIYQEFQTHHIEFAYPTQTLYVNQT